MAARVLAFLCLATLVSTKPTTSDHCRDFDCIVEQNGYHFNEIDQRLRAIETQTTAHEDHIETQISNMQALLENMKTELDAGQRRIETNFGGSTLDELDASLTDRMENMKTELDAGQRRIETKIGVRMDTIEGLLRADVSGPGDKLNTMEDRTDITTIESPTTPTVELTTIHTGVGSIRLTHGSYGRVEVFNQGVWGTVCDDGFDRNDRAARVVCRSLGLTGGTVSGFSPNGSSVYGEGSGQIWLDDVQCTGSEQRIELCPHSGWGLQNCIHGEDVGVDCTV